MINSYISGHIEDMKYLINACGMGVDKLSWDIMMPELTQTCYLKLVSVNQQTITNAMPTHKTKFNKQWLASADENGVKMVYPWRHAIHFQMHVLQNH